MAAIRSQRACALRAAAVLSGDKTLFGCNTTMSQSILLHSGRVWDASGKEAFDADVLLEGNRIAAVAPGLAQQSPNTRRVDISGHTIIPGLTDGHAHLPFAHKANMADTGDIPPEDHA